MRLLGSTDFAFRILLYLGRQSPDMLVNVETLAARLGGLSLNHLYKIVQDLAALGIVRTVRGAGGGVALARPPEDIRLGALIQALEQDQALVECLRGDHGDCVLDNGCHFRRFLTEAQSSFYGVLNEKTLADCLPHSRIRSVRQPRKAGSRQP